MRRAATAKPTGPLHDPAAFPFAAALAARWREIHAEYLGIRDRLVDWIEPELYGQGWKVFGLYDFPHGAPIADHVALCPVTASLVARHVPAHGAAGFSVLQPGTRIKPHVGYAGRFLRFHLGLDVPAGDCALRVGERTVSWHNGAPLVFDDRGEHEAWNLTERDRAILLVDFVPHAQGAVRRAQKGP